MRGDIVSRRRESYRRPDRAKVLADLVHGVDYRTPGRAPTFRPVFAGISQSKCARRDPPRHPKTITATVFSRLGKGYDVAVNDNPEVIAFVAGATGYTGREVVRALRDRGVRTVAHVRPGSRDRDAWRERFESLGAEVDLTAWEEASMVATFERLRPTLVFALLGTTRARAKADAASYDTVDHGLTAMLMTASATLEPPPRFIYLSSAGAPKKEPAAKSYMHARWQVEKELNESQLPFVIARPSIITGTDRDDDRPGERIGAAVANGALGALGLFGMKRLRDRYQSTTNVTLAEALVRLALDESRARAVVESEELR